MTDTEIQALIDDALTRFVKPELARRGRDPSSSVGCALVVWPDPAGPPTTLLNEQVPDVILRFKPPGHGVPLGEVANLWNRPTEIERVILPESHRGGAWLLFMRGPGPGEKWIFAGDLGPLEEAVKKWFPDSRLCLGCRKPFVPSRPNKKYCSPACGHRVRSRRSMQNKRQKSVS